MKIRLLSFCFFLSISVATASKIDSLEVFSQSMGKIIKNVVVTPDLYAPESNSYPVLYILHGASDDYRFWLNHYPEIRDFADQYNIILVFPDGGAYSWYFDSPVDKKSQYETYIAKELIESVDKNYNTITSKNGRAITGVSMGGHGAFYLAFKHQTIWGAAGSISGGLDIRPFFTKWHISKYLGSYSDYPELWEKNTVINMVHLLDENYPSLIFDCGTEDFFYSANKQMHEKLLTQNISHRYSERQGRHNVTYFNNSINQQMLFFKDYFENNIK